MEDKIKLFIRESLSSENVFDKVMEKIIQYRDKPAHTIADLKQKNNKIVGDLFEAFCLLYLKHIGEYDEVLLLSSISKEVLATLGLSTKDVGIDIIAWKGEAVYAIQCKYRSKTIDRNKRQVHRVNWSDIATFSALCANTGPWSKHILMTNADYVTRYGHKGYKDVTIAKKTFQSVTIDKWREMSNVSNTDSSTISSPIVAQDLGSVVQPQRLLRQAWLDRL